MTLFVGIDPGNRGYIVGIHHQQVIAHPMPKTDEELPGLFSELKKKGIYHLVLEKAQVMPKNGAVSMFRYGERYGFLRGVITSLKISHSLVTPRAWHKAMVKNDKHKDPKQRALATAMRLNPEFDFVPPRCKKPHDGLVDAFLMAHYCKKEFS